MRATWVIVLVLAVGACCYADAAEFWDPAPFTTNIVASLLLLALGALLVDEYIAFRANEAWDPVAAAALEDLGRVCRAVWSEFATGFELLHGPVPQEAVRAQLLTAQGRANAEGACAGFAAGFEGRQQLMNIMRPLARGTKDAIVKWAPTLTPRAPLAEHLSELAGMHRRLVQILAFLSVEPHMQLPITADDVRDKVIAVLYEAEELDRRFFKRAEELKPLYE